MSSTGNPEVFDEKKKKDNFIRKLKKFKNLIKKGYNLIAIVS